MVLGRNQLKDSDEHYTPREVFDCLNITFGTDVCSPPGGIPWIPAINYFDIERDGLANSWFGTVWMNPPFSNPTPWVHKFIEHGDGIALCVVSSSKWFHALWNASDAVVPYPRTWKFERPDGTKKPIAFACMLFAMGAVGTSALKNIPEYRVR